MRFYTILLVLISGKLFSQDPQLASASDLTKGAQYAANNFVGLNKIKLSQHELQRVTEMIAELKGIYESNKSYPDSIIGGWHEVAVTDNSKTLKTAKVYVDNNRIRKFFIDDCIELEFTMEGEITHGKASITLKKVSGDPLRAIDIYFMDDLDKPRTFPPPSKPGYVCFWTRKKKLLNQKIVFAGQRIDQLSKVFDKEPMYFDNGTTTIIIKPGSYRLEILQSGNNLDRVINVQSGTCTYYQVD
jgi:hypothetical protein